MRRLVGLIVLMALLVGLVALAGCGAVKEGTITTPQGDITYKSSSKEITITGQDKTVTWTAEGQSEKSLGVPIPDSAELVRGSIIAVAGSESGEKWSGASFLSSDDVETVISWYKEQLSGMTALTDTSTVLDGQPVGLFQLTEGDLIKSVTVSAAASGSKGKTEINVATAAGVK